MRATPGFTFVLLVLSGTLLACGNASEAGVSSSLPEDEGAVEAAPPELGERAPAAFSAEDAAYPAPHPSMPQIPRHGGVVLRDPRIVTVTFPGDALRSKLEAFGDQVGELAWWGAIARSYGFGPARGAGHAAIATAPPAAMTFDEVEQWLAARIAAGEVPAPTDQTLYALYFPAATTVSFTAAQGGGSSCQAFLGYHTSFDVTVGGQQVPTAYAVINRCGDLDQVTETASHEMAEAASDPHPLDDARAGYVFFEDAPWTVLGGENADMCAGVSGVTEAGWALTRVWSNEAAAIGQQPCVPAAPAATPYFNAGIVHELLTAAPGGTATTEVDCYSFGPLPSAMTLSAQANGGSGTRFTFSPKTCKNGDKVTMTVTMPARIPHGTRDNYTLLARLDDGTQHLWRGAVQVQ
jgi:hypothetical protein